MLLGKMYIVKVENHTAKSYVSRVFLGPGHFQGPRRMSRHVENT